MKNTTSGLKSELGAYKTREILENYLRYIEDSFKMLC